MTASTEELPREFGPYELSEPLGVGSQGSVYLARLIRHAGLGPKLAVKTLGPDHKATDPRLLGALIREGRIGQRVTHPNVVRVLDVGAVAGRPYMAMEYVDGCSLTQLRKACGLLRGRAWLEVAMQATLGLAALHDVGVVGDIGTPLLHLDLKPGNLLVDRTGCVKLVDFGISQFMAGSTSAKALGTPGYMSVEQFQGEDPDVRADLFGLAVTLHRLLSPTRLLASSPLPEALLSVVELEDRLDEPELWAPIDDAVPGAADVLRRCLRRDRERRYPDAHALWAALSRLRPRAPAGPPLEELVQKALGGTPPPKAQRPPSRPFVGRDHVLTRLRNRTANRSVTWVTGGDGMGKTALARHALPGATWVTAEGVWTAAELQRRVLVALGLAADADIHVVLPLIPPRHVVLDGVDAASADLADAILGWSRAATDMRWIVTSRGAPPAPDAPADVVELAPLDDHSGAALLQRHAPELDDATAADLAQRLHGRPAVLELLAIAIGQGTPVEQALQSAASIRTTAEAIDWQWRRLADDERHVLAQLIVFQGVFSISAADAVVTCEEGVLGELVEELAEQRLIERVGDTMLIPAHLRAALEARQGDVLSPEEVQALAVRHADHLARMGTVEWLLQLSGPLASDALRALVAGRADLLAAYAAARDAGATTAAVRCLKALFAAAEAGRGAPPELATVHDVLSRPGIAPHERIRLALWCVESHTREVAAAVEALARQALEEAAELADEALLCRAEIALGQLLVTRGRPTEAGERLATGVRLAAALGDRRQEGRALLEQARLFGRLGQRDDAAEAIDRALLLARARQDAVQVGWLRSMQGVMLARQGQREEALATLQQAGEHLEVLGRWSLAATTWQNFAAAIHGEDVTKAMGALKQSYRLLMQGGATARANEVRSGVASLLVELGRSDEARAIYDEISDSASQIGALEAQRRVAVYRIAQELTERRWADLDRRCAEARALRVDEGNAWFGVALAYCEARLALHGGDLDVARAQVAVLSSELGGTRFPNYAWMPSDLRGRLKLREGDAAGAVPELQAAYDRSRDHDTGAAIDTLEALVRALEATGAAEEAAGLVRAARAWTAGTLHPAGPTRATLEATARRLRLD